jgi:hypothetical protein
MGPDTLLHRINTAGVCMTDNSSTGSFRMDLPKDLVSAAQHVPQPSGTDLTVEGWRNSWLARISEMLVGKD